MTNILQGKKLLIVEDEADLREPLAAEFETLGCTVFQAENGRKGFEILQREQIDGVVSDIRMPGGDGIELLKNIKELHCTSPAVILITGFSDLSKEDAYHLGAEAVLSKPFDLDEIDAAVTRMLTPREVRWSAAISEKTKQRVAHTYSTLLGAMDEGAIGLGRGGIFLRGPEKQASVGSAVTLHIQFEKGGVLGLDGSGIVRWVRASGGAGLPEGCGIEFETLSEVARKEVLGLTEQLKMTPYIPKHAMSVPK